MEHARFGIDLGGTKIELIALDEGGRELIRRRHATPRGDYQATVEAIAMLVESAQAELGVVASVGVGAPGSPSRLTGLMRNSNSLVLNGRRLGADLSARLGRQVRLANDADCFALSEARDGAGTGFRCVFGVILGTGVGGGIVVDGRLLDGPNGIAGEWGHNPLPWPRSDELPGPVCYCQRRGCIETWLCGPALHRQALLAASRQEPPLDAHDLVARALAGEADSLAVLDAWLDRLARCLAGVVNLLDPDAIVIGGGLSAIDSIYQVLAQRMQPWVFSESVVTPVLRNVHGDSSGVRGAAWLWPAGV